MKSVLSIDIWQKTKSGKKKELNQFLKKIKKQNSKLINQLADSTHETVFKALDCLDCANCCSSIPPIVNRTDANRLAKHLGMTAAKFCQNYLLEDEDGDWVMNTSPCPFLMENHKCFIYEFRPRACREYPHTDHMQFSKNINLHKTNINYCPAVFHIVNQMMKSIG